MEYIRAFEKTATLPVTIIRGLAAPALKKTLGALSFGADTQADTAEVIPIRRDAHGTPLQGWADEMESRQPEAPDVDLGDQPLPPRNRFKREQRVPVDRIYD